MMPLARSNSSLKVAMAQDSAVSRRSAGVRAGRRRARSAAPLAAHIRGRALDYLVGIACVAGVSRGSGPVGISVGESLS
jgi:hypothetical protein